MFEKKDAHVEQKNEDLIGQFNDLSIRLPQESRHFYQNTITKCTLDNPSAFHKEIISVMNYELVFLALQNKNKDEITTDDLKQFLPWTRAVNKDAWEEMLNTNSPQSIYPLLKDVLNSRKMLLSLPVEQQSKQDLEAFIPSSDIEELLKTLQKHGSLNKFPISILELGCGASEVESNKLSFYGFKLEPLFSDSMIRMLSIDDRIQLFTKYTQADSFYTELLTQVDLPEFKKQLLNAMCMEHALSALNARLEVTHEKLAKIIKMLAPEIRKDFENRDLNTEPKNLLLELKVRLGQMKDDLLAQVHEIKEQQERARQAQALENENRERLIREQQERAQQQENERRAQELRDRQERERRKPMLLILDTLKFDHYIERITTKAQKFAKINTQDHTKAKDAAVRLLNSLDNAKTHFLDSNEPMDIKKRVFQQSCIDAIERSRLVLEQHRGWKQILANFASALVSVCTLGTINCATGRGIFGLFPVKTNYQEILDDFTEKLNVRI